MLLNGEEKESAAGEHSADFGKTVCDLCSRLRQANWRLEGTPVWGLSDVLSATDERDRTTDWFSFFLRHQLTDSSRVSVSGGSVCSSG